MGRALRKFDIVNRMLFFFFITALLGASLFIFAILAVHNHQNRERLAEQLVGLVSVLSSGIQEEHIISVLNQKSAQTPSYEILTEQLLNITKEYSPYFHADIIKYKDNKAFLIATSQSENFAGRKVLTDYLPSQEYMEALADSAESGEPVYSKIYEREDFSYLSAFSPIRDEQGNIIAFLAINADTRYLQPREQQDTVLLFGILALIVVSTYFLLRTGINRILSPVIEKNRGLDQLQVAEKMNAIGQLAASVAHEIRNPMTVVKGFLQIFLSKEKLTSEEHMYVKLMIEEMSRAETIINDYLSLAKPDMGESERFQAGKLAHKVMDLIHSYAMMSKNIELRTIVDEEFELTCNKSELRQVLINILKNGIEAMKDGGTLTLKVYKDSLFGNFEVRDTGIGMTKEEVNRLGTAFYSLKEKGTGIGLMVCYQIISRMKGRIDVESEKGKGTVFRIRVPLNKEHSD